MPEKKKKKKMSDEYENKQLEMSTFQEKRLSNVFWKPLSWPNDVGIAKQAINFATKIPLSFIKMYIYPVVPVLVKSDMG